MNYFCCTDLRRNTVRLHPGLNGIDYLEVLDKESDPYKERQTTLFVHFIKPLNPGSITPLNLKIEGGERIKNIKIICIDCGPKTYFPASPPEGEEKVLMVKVSEAGDFSTYTFRLVKDSLSNAPPDGFDTVLSAVDFSFKVLCDSEFDCKPACGCITRSSPSPEINYLAKDYATFRQLMLDRILLLLPGWKERNAADMGIVMVELLAYAADYLSYRQDAIATEAYLATARKRISVKRHVRLVDYEMHDGCNARAWLHIKVPDHVNGLELKQGKDAGVTKILTRVKDLPSVFKLDSYEFKKAVNDGAKVFEPMHDILLYAAHNEMTFYTWCEKACCLPKGATQATLKGSFPNLKPGNVLILSEVKGPHTGRPEDADPVHRHAIRLTEVTLSFDLLCNETPGSPPLGSPPHYLPVTEIKWDQSDALPFSLCISTASGAEDVSVALGNIVLVDHGRTVYDEKKSSLLPDEVPDIAMKYAGEKENGCDPCEPADAIPVLRRFQPKLIYSPLTYASPIDLNGKSASASTLIKSSVWSAMPVITLREAGIEGNTRGNLVWEPQYDLLNSAFNAREFVVEQESDGTAYIRFGNDRQGANPSSGTKFLATYRIGNGIEGNIGANSLAHIATNDAAVLAGLEIDVLAWNPMAAQGGTEPETMEEVKQYAPVAFRKQLRAVTANDYEVFAQQCRPDVQKAAATFRWTGSWKTIFLSIDRLEGLEVDSHFEHDLRSCLEQYRMAGVDVEIDVPVYVSLEIDMEVCVDPKYIASDVKRALLQVFSNRTLPDGRRGIFHPDNFSFGQPVYLSSLYAAAQIVPGVLSVRFTKFQRQGIDSTNALQTKKLEFKRREIARLYNNPNFPESGIFRLSTLGGRS